MKFVRRLVWGSRIDWALVEAVCVVHYLRQQPTAVDWVTTLANPELIYSSDAGPFETEAECHPSSPSFVLYYEIDVDAVGDGDAVDGVVKRSLMSTFLDCRGVDRFLY